MDKQIMKGHTWDIKGPKIQTRLNGMRVFSKDYKDHRYRISVIPPGDQNRTKYAEASIVRNGTKMRARGFVLYSEFLSDPHGAITPLLEDFRKSIEHIKPVN